VAAIIWTIVVHARAEDVGASFDAANKLYEQGRFKDAAAAYQGLVKSGQSSAPIFFNLGNAFLKSGEIGKAVAAYRTAARFTPRDPDLRANLQFARNQVQGPTVPTGKWDQFLGKMTLNEWTVLASALIWAWLLLLCALQLRPALKPLLRGYVAGLAIVILVVAFCLGQAIYKNRMQHVAIVIAKDASVHNGPLEESQKAFVAHDGAELLLLDQKEDWLQVSAGPGKVGWLRRDQVVLTSGV
jgi:tetratricopeptide (TPR) repeat protein